MDYRARTGAGARAGAEDVAGAAILTSWSRAKMEWLRNTAAGDHHFIKFTRRSNSQGPKERPLVGFFLSTKN